MRLAARIRPVSLAFAATLALPLAASSAEEEKVVVVAEGRKVSIEYTLSFDDGTQPESNVGEEPVVFEQGKHDILPALETALAGMKVSETKKVTLEPVKGYGEPDPRLLQEVDLAQIPEGARVAGTQLTAEDEQGNQRPVRVHEVRADKIVVDLNHPLAGKTLHFDVKVLKIE
jgi:FKBP-type peptidyl-prolyl cis-trans isomerase 2